MIASDIEHGNGSTGHAPEGRCEDGADVGAGLLQVSVGGLASTLIGGIARHDREAGPALGELVHHVRLVDVAAVVICLPPVAEHGEGERGRRGGGHLRRGLGGRIRSEQVGSGQPDTVAVRGVRRYGNRRLPLVLGLRVDRDAGLGGGGDVGRAISRLPPLQASRRGRSVGRQLTVIDDWSESVRYGYRVRAAFGAALAGELSVGMPTLTNARAEKSKARRHARQAGLIFMESPSAINPSGGPSRHEPRPDDDTRSGYSIACDLCMQFYPGFRQPNYLDLAVRCQGKTARPHQWIPSAHHRFHMRPKRASID